MDIDLLYQVFYNGIKCQYIGSVDVSMDLTIGTSSEEVPTDSIKGTCSGGVTTMGRLGQYILVLGATLLIINLFAGCCRENEAQSTYNLEDFEIAIKDKGYVYEMEDAQQDFLPTTRKRMIFNQEVLDIYLFDDDQKMEKEADNIDSSGCGYDNGSTAIKVSWVSYPHFYKKGSLIIQYIGEDENMISELEDLLGEQFAGYTP
jgi:hypothetical protein